MKEIRSYYHVWVVVLFVAFSFAITNSSSSGDYSAIGSADKFESNVRLNVVVPASDSTTTTHKRHRIAANADPDSRVFINDKEAKVYPTGGFAGMAEVPFGNSITQIRVVTTDGTTRTKNLHFYRPDEIRTSSSDPLVIESDHMLPDQTLEVGKNEVIEVQFRGSPGMHAYFSIDGIEKDFPMHEKDSAKTNGIGGIYTGQYRVQDDDFALDTRITYTLHNRQGDTTSALNNSSLSITPDAFPRTAEIHGRMAHLNAGYDIDRLGGSRLGFLDPGVMVEITGRTGGLYRVRLSEDLDGYLPIRFARLLPEGTHPPRSKSGSITATGNEKNDIVSLTLGQRLPYITNMRTRPDNAIDVDIYGAVSNTKWINLQESAKGIRDIEWKQAGPNHFRLTIHIEHDVHWGYHVGYGVGNSLRIQVQRPPAIVSRDRPLEGVHIAIDAGHGGSNLGAIGSSGTEEKTVVFDIARKVREKLEKEGAMVLMTREQDISLSLVERSEMIVSSDAQVLISIHANSIGSATDPLSIRGTASYYRHYAFRPFAGSIHNRMLELPLRNFGFFGDFNFTLNALTELPNVLIETGFISHPEEEMKLLDPEFQDRIAEKITEGLRDFLIRHGQVVEVPS